MIKIYEIFTTEEHYVFVMERPELCKDLFDILQLKVTLSESEARRYFSQILEANINCEENGVIHRDLKPENILVDLLNDEAKLIDFGLASEVQNKPFLKFRGEICGLSKLSKLSLRTPTTLNIKRMLELNCKFSAHQGARDSRDGAGEGRVGVIVVPLRS